MKKWPVIVLSALLAVSICANGYQFYRAEKLNEYVNTMTDQILMQDNPALVASRAKVIERNNEILERFGLNVADYRPYFINSPDLEGKIAFYFFNNLNKEPKKYEPMFYQSGSKPFYYFTVQTDDTTLTLVKLELQGGQSVAEIERKTLPAEKSERKVDKNVF